MCRINDSFIQPTKLVLTSPTEDERLNVVCHNLMKIPISTSSRTRKSEFINAIENFYVDCTSSRASLKLRTVIREVRTRAHQCYAILEAAALVRFQRGKTQRRGGKLKGRSRRKEKRTTRLAKGENKNWLEKHAPRNRRMCAKSKNISRSRVSA